MAEVVLERTIGAPIERVFDAISDHVGYTRWVAPMAKIELRRRGSPEPNAVGAVRQIRALGLVIEEEVIESVRPSRVVYRLTSGLPIRDHLGEIALTPCAEGTRLQWRVRFRAALPGMAPAIAKVLEVVLGVGLWRLDRLERSR